MLSDQTESLSQRLEKCRFAAREARYSAWPSRHLRATILQLFPIYENIAKIPIQEGGGGGRSYDER
jgi:hypothetical protein